MFRLCDLKKYIKITNKKMETKIYQNYADFLRREEKRLNGVTLAFLEENNIDLESLNLTNCEGCFNCINCESCFNCEDCKNCDNCGDCKNCIKCEDCKNCYKCRNCRNCESCYKYYDCEKVKKYKIN